jgi:1-acylglycerone phosphate reductase
MSAVQLDVTNHDSLNRAKHDVAQITGGKLDILVNNACVLISYLPIK